MPSEFYLVWYFVIVVIIGVATYFALMALDFSKLFKPNSTWQIKLLAILISAAIGFIIASGMLDIIRYIKEIA